MALIKSKQAANLRMYYPTPEGEQYIDFANGEFETSEPLIIEFCKLDGINYEVIETTTKKGK